MFFGGNSIVALDIGTSSIKLAEVDMTRRGPVLKRFGIIRLNPGLVSGGEILQTSAVTQAIDALVKASKSKRKLVSTGIWGTAAIVKKIAMPRMDEKLVGEQIKWEAEQYIPFDINEVSLDYHILRNRTVAGESMEVLLVAAKQEYVFKIIESIDSTGLKCAILDISGFALANCFEANYGIRNEPVALVNMGAGVTNIVIVEKGEVIFSRDVSVGGNLYTSEISKAMSVSLPEAEALKISASLGQEVPQEIHSILTSATEQVVEEIRGTFDFFGATSGSSGGAISKMFISGGTAYIPGLVQLLSRTVGVPFEMFDSFAKITFDSKEFTGEYISQIRAISPVVLGLAMRKVGD
jgi:type IV pilus assembly protein PilM